MRIEADEKINLIAVELPSSIPVFEHYKVRFCNDKTATLAEACQAAGVSTGTLLETLRSLVHPEDGKREDWDHAPLPALVRFILEHHHTSELRQIDTLQRLFERVVPKHGSAHPELPEIQSFFGRMASGLKEHMRIEETDLFPSFRQEVAPGAGENNRREIAFRCIPLILSLEKDHQRFNTDWAAVRSRAGGFKPPADACTGYRALYNALSQMEHFQQEHIRKENDVLFKRIKAMAT